MASHMALLLPIFMVEALIFEALMLIGLMRNMVSCMWAINGMTNHELFPYKYNVMLSVWDFIVSRAHCDVVCSLSLVKAEEEASALQTLQFCSGEKGTWPQRRERKRRGFIM
jgi:hypothetical protein